MVGAFITGIAIGGKGPCDFRLHRGLIFYLRRIREFAAANPLAAAMRSLHGVSVTPS
jgi:hypothetical protein